MTSAGFVCIRGGNARHPHRRNAKKFGDQGHRIRGELPAASARAGTRGAFQVFELRVGHGATRVRAHSLKHVLNGNGMTVKLAGGNRTAIENEAGSIQSGEGHHAARNGFVTADENDEGVKTVPTATS